jgi:hypothetical protein
MEEPKRYIGGHLFTATEAFEALLRVQAVLSARTASADELMAALHKELKFSKWLPVTQNQDALVKLDRIREIVTSGYQHEIAVRLIREVFLLKQE